MDEQASHIKRTFDELSEREMTFENMKNYNERLTATDDIVQAQIENSKDDFSEAVETMSALREDDKEYDNLKSEGLCRYKMLQQALIQINAMQDVLQWSILRVEAYKIGYEKKSALLENIDVANINSKLLERTEKFYDNVFGNVKTEVNMIAETQDRKIEAMREIMDRKIEFVIENFQSMVKNYVLPLIEHNKETYMYLAKPTAELDSHILTMTEQLKNMSRPKRVPIVATEPEQELEDEPEEEIPEEDKKDYVSPKKNADIMNDLRPTASPQPEKKPMPILGNEPITGETKEDMKKRLRAESLETYRKWRIENGMSPEDESVLRRRREQG